MDHLSPRPGPERDRPRLDLTQTVTATLPSPSISHLRVRAVHRKLRLRLTLSESARLTVVVWKLVPGQIVQRRCRPGARHGRRCQAAFYKLTLDLTVQAGVNALRPRMRALAPGRYRVTVVAIGPDGARSRVHAVVVTVRRR